MPTIVRTTGAMTNGDVLSDTRIYFVVRSEGDTQVQALPPVDPENPTVGERLFAQGRLPQVDDGTPNGQITSTEWIHVDDSIGTFTAGDAATLRSLLKKLHDQFKLDSDL